MLQSYNSVYSYIPSCSEEFGMSLFENTNIFYYTSLYHKLLLISVYIEAVVIRTLKQTDAIFNINMLHGNGEK